MRPSSLCRWGCRTVEANKLVGFSLSQLPSSCVTVNPLRTATTVNYAQRRHLNAANNATQNQKQTPRRTIPKDNKTLADFIQQPLKEGNALHLTYHDLLPSPLHCVDSSAASIRQSSAADAELTTSTSPLSALQGLHYYIETYGCQMNVSDSEIVASVLQNSGLKSTDSESTADVILINTCAIREGAENRVFERLRMLRRTFKTEPDQTTVPSTFKFSSQAQHHSTHSTDTVSSIDSKSTSLSSSASTVVRVSRGRRVLCVLGCTAERLKVALLERESAVDIVCGPDSYRHLPQLIAAVYSGAEATAMHVQLSVEETYADIAPVRNVGQVTAFCSIMRGCENMCSYCIVPRTRGRERSRDIESILSEITQLSKQGVKEVTLLGQNVNSYNFIPIPEQRRLSTSREAKSRGFVNISRRPETGVGFTELLDRLSLVDPEMRIRFTSPHPKDFPDDLIHLIAERHNLCKYIHLPAQSGSTRVLDRMRRGYTREAYLKLVSRMKHIIPDLALSTDIIAGFCGETEADHLETVSLMQQVKYDQAFTFAYSQRERTHAHRHYADDVEETVKFRRLREIIDVFQSELKAKLQHKIGSIQCVLVEGVSKRSAAHLKGRCDDNRKIHFELRAIPTLSQYLNSTQQTPDFKSSQSHSHSHYRLPITGDYVAIRVTGITAFALKGEPLGFTTLREFYMRLDKSQHTPTQNEIKAFDHQSIKMQT